MTKCDDGEFSFRDFYTRRAFRLIPATLSTLVFTIIGSYFILTYSSWIDFQKQLLGALTFTANFSLMFQTDYFAASAESKPLLHMWSLAVEEQFYFFAPIIIFFVPKRFRTLALLIFLAVSLVGCLILVKGWIDLPISSKGAQTIAFFMLPTRAWELIIGCCGGWLMLRHPQLSISRKLKWVALFGITLLLLTPLGTTHPAEDALLVSLFTFLLLIGQDNWLPKTTITNLTRKIGDWSYSIYLVHWPLFAFANNIFLEDVPVWVSLMLVALSVGLGAAQYRYVETPFRYGFKKGGLSAAIKLIAVTSIPALFSLPAVSGVIYQESIRSEKPLPNIGLSSVCDQEDNFFHSFPECQTTPEPRVALLGDSIAMQWGQVLAEHSETFGGFVQMTKSACAPALGVAQVHGRYTERWAADCTGFVSDAVDVIIESDSIETVVISSGYTQVLMAQGQSMLVSGELIPANEEIGFAAAKSLIELLTRAGKTVVLIGTPPMTGADFGFCQERKLNNSITIGLDGCTFKLSDFKTLYSPLFLGLEKLGEIEGVSLVWPHDSICNAGICSTSLDDMVLYRDRSHLTLEATKIIFDDLDIVSTLKR